MEVKNMKSTGIVRKIDEVGRMVIPMELRRTMNLTEKDDALEIFTDGDMIVLKKYNPSCIFCKEMEDIKEFGSVKVCKACADMLYKSFN